MVIQLVVFFTAGALIRTHSKKDHLSIDADSIAYLSSVILF